MKFIPLQAQASQAEKAVLEQEYAAAADFTPARVGSERFFFKVGRKVYYLPLTEITRCFRRVELVSARVGCCGQSLPMENVVICGEGEQELAQIHLGSERMGKALLSALETACPNAQFGYVRDPEQKSAVRHI